MELTENERKLAEKNHNLIYSFLQQMRLSVEDYYDVAAIGLCKAAQTYKGTNAFSTYAYRCMYNELISCRRMEERCIQSEVSIDEKSFEESEVKNWLRGEVGEDACFVVSMKQVLSKLSESDRMVLILWFYGYNCVEIAGRLGYSVGHIHRKQKHAIDMLHEGLSE